MADSVQYSGSSANIHSNTDIIWSVTLPDMAAINLNSTGLEYEGWSQTVLGSGWRIPFRTKLIYTLNGPPDVTYDVGTFRVLPGMNVPEPEIEQAKGMELEVLPELSPNNDFIRIKHINDYDGYQLWAVNVLGARYNVAGSVWQIPEYLQIRIHTDLDNTLIPEGDGLELNSLSRSGSQLLTRDINGLGQGKIKIHVLKDGIYRIYYDSLAQIPDFPEEAIPSRSLTLRAKGAEQAIHVTDHGDNLFDGGDYFDFIGKQNYFNGSSQYFDAFSDINVYWLDWGGNNGLRFVEESGALVELSPVRPTSFWDRQHIEEDNEFERLGQVDTNLPTITRDHYFWESVNSGVTKEVSYFLPDPFRGSSENLEISLGLHGLTYSEEAGEVKGHTIFAFMNDHSIGDGSWVQQEEYVLNSPAALNLSHNILSSDGNNVLAIFAPVSTEPGNYDKVDLNWIEIGYEHLLRANDNQLRFRKSFINPSTNLEYEIQGFQSSNLVLYKEGLSKITGFSIRENWDNDDPQYSLVFQDESTEATPDYWAASNEGLLRPVKAVVDTLANLREQDANLIIVTIPAFVGDLEPYVAFKQSEGWNPIVVSVADIYDEFNYGIHSPLAIKSFLRYANNNWPSEPQYVVLFGDAISNPQQVKRDTRIQNIPTFYMQTYGWGAAEADYWFTLINGDDYLPDLKIGRIPCNSLEDFNTSIAKLIQYGSGNNFGAWQNEIITIAGFDAIFKNQSESLLKNTIPPAFIPSRIFIDRDSEGQIFWGDTDSLVEHWNRGKLLINFLGHGGGAVWADRSLFVRDDINYLHPEVPPAFVTSMTCFTASFAQTRGLGEVVLTESPVGAIGWFGSSGVGWIINDYLMIQPLMRHLLEEDKTVGEIINMARMEYFLANSGYDYLKPSMLFQYNFLGDPTTRLLRPEFHEDLVADKTIYTPTEQLTLNYDFAVSGEIHLLALNGQNQPWWSLPQIFPAESNSQFVFSQEPAAPTGVGRMVYTLDRGENETAYQGYAAYGISTDWFEHQAPTAEQLAQSPKIPIRVKFHSTSIEADSMVMVVYGSNQNRFDLVPNGEWWELSDTTRLVAGSSSTSYYFSAYHDSTLIQSSSTFILYLPADISMSINDIRPGSNVNRCGLFLDYSLSGKESLQAAMHVEVILSDDNLTLDQERTVNEGHNSIFIPVFFDQDSVQVSASLNTTGDVDASDNALTKKLTSEYYQIFPGMGITFGGAHGDTLNLWAEGSLTISSNDTGWVSVRPYHESISALSGVTLLQDSTIYSIESNTNDLLVHIVSPQQVFRNDPNLAVWQVLSTSGSGTYLMQGAGFIAMGQKQDFTGPEVSMMVEGQLFFDGDYLLKSTHLNLIAEDENGFAWDKSGVNVLLDASEVEVQLGDTTQSGQLMSVSIALDLSVGDHSIAYSMSDALGNWSDEVLVSGVVAGAPAIFDYGNFPNPFEGETLIIYELTQPLDDVHIDIYTLAGYKLHTIDLFNARSSIGLGAIGYHEVPWNGRDRNNDFVANGVYFYRITGQSEDGEIAGPIGKMVKNR